MPIDRVGQFRPDSAHPLSRMVSPRPYAAAAGGIGLFLVLLATAVMGGWLLHWPWVVTLGNPEFVIVFSTALALALLGAGVVALSAGSLAPALA
ncbi:hypothetical protein, partial [Ralstonia pseudosolanacearum]